MRSLTEVLADVRVAKDQHDQEQLQKVAAELRTFDDPEAHAMEANVQGIVSLMNAQPELAMKHFRDSLDRFKALNDVSGIAMATGDIAQGYILIGELAEALVWMFRALDLNEQRGSRMGVALVSGNIGIVYLETGNYPEAAEWFDRSLLVSHEIDDQIGVAINHNSLGTVYQWMGDDERSLRHYRKALEMYEELDNLNGIATAEGNIGNVIGSAGEHEEAIAWYRKAIDKFEQLGNRIEVAKFWSNTGAELVALGRIDETREILRRLEDMDLDDPKRQLSITGMKATLAERDGDLDTAQSLYRSVVENARTLSFPIDEAEAQLSLRDLAQQRNDLKGYIEHNDAYAELIEKMRGTEASVKLTILEKEREIAKERAEHDRERALLYGALPESVATRMLRGEDVTGDHYDQASILFLDIVNFTSLSDRIPPGHVVHLLEQIFSALDDVSEKYGVIKIKTIGDSYMAVAGVPEPLDDHVQRSAQCALEMLRTMNDLEITMPPELGDTSWIQDVGEIAVRIGIHNGPVTAGVIGKQRLQYDVWGDTVNMASRMESTGEPGRIQVSSAFAEQLLLQVAVADKNGSGTANSNSQQQPKLTERGVVDIKGKGSMTTYWLEGA